MSLQTDLSVGHKADLASAMRLTKACVLNFHLPEPLRLAKLAVDKHKEGKVVDFYLGGGQTSLF